MGTKKFTCRICKSEYDSSELMNQCQAKPIQNKHLENGYTFKLDRAREGVIIVNPSKEKFVLPPLKEENSGGEDKYYGVIDSQVKPNSEHMQIYKISVVFNLDLKRNPDPRLMIWGEIPGNSTLIGILSNEEFARIKDDLIRWTKRTDLTNIL